MSGRATGFAARMVDAIGFVLDPWLYHHSNMERCV